jgi:acetylglutamate kinase
MKRKDGMSNEIFERLTDALMTVGGAVPVVKCDEFTLLIKELFSPAEAELAAAMHAKKLILLTDVVGVMRDPNDEKTLISILTVDEVQKLIREGVIKKGMIPKTEACLKAIHGGVKQCHILKGTAPHVLLQEILTKSGAGTMIERGK